MGYGLRFYHKSLTLGTVLDWFVPDQDMPNAPNKRGTRIFRDIIETPFGNTFLYDKGKRKEWDLEFSDIQTLSKGYLEFLESGWLQKRAITVIFFGTSVIGTNESAGSMATAGQLWGTGFIQLTDLPAESAFNLWNVNIKIIEFGTNQSFV